MNSELIRKYKLEKRRILVRTILSCTCVRDSIGGDKIITAMYGPQFIEVCPTLFNGYYQIRIPGIGVGYIHHREVVEV